jgi:hypothetical protein
MLRKVLLVVAALVVILPLGCSTARPVPWGWAHNKRLVNGMVDGFENAAVSFDRLILQDYREFPDKLQEAYTDFDRIAFDMEPRTLEDL